MRQMSVVFSEQLSHISKSLSFMLSPLWFWSIARYSWVRCLKSLQQYSLWSQDVTAKAVPNGEGKKMFHAVIWSL